MTQPNDTQAPERIWAWEANTHLWCSDQPRTEYKHAATPYLRADLAAAQTAAAWLAGRGAAAKLNDQQIRDYVDEHGSTDPSTGMVEFPGDGEEWVGDREELCDAIRDLTPPADLSAALDALIAERVREAWEAAAKEADETAQEADLFSDKHGRQVAERIASTLRARASKEGR